MAWPCVFSEYVQSLGYSIETPSLLFWYGMYDGWSDPDGCANASLEPVTLVPVLPDCVTAKI